MTSIEDGTFYNCSSLTSISIPNSVISISGSAFNNCSSLISITIPDAVTSIKDYTFQKCSGLTSIIIPNTVNSIGKHAFDGCSSLISITIPEAVTSIEDGTFWDCSSLISIIIPNTVSSISGSAFEGCSSLSSITIPDAMTSIEDGTFRYCSGLTSVTIPNTITSIGKNAFEGCRNLTSIRIPDAVTIIEEWTFLGCSSLASVTFSNAVTSIGDCAFQYCSGLNSITIPNAVTCIGKNAFYGCSGLTSITIPHAVTSIGESAFSGCRNLASVISDIKNPFEIEENVFPSDIYTSAILTIPAGTKAQYLSTSSWNKFTTIIDTETSTNRTVHVETAGTLTDYIHNSERYVIEELTITGELNGTDFRLIRDMAGNDYLGNPTQGRLKSLDISGARIVEGGEKYLDTDKVRFTIPLSWSGMGGISEDGDDYHYSLYLSTQTDKIGDCLFIGTSLINIVLPNNARSMGYYAFAGCGALNSVVIPNSVTRIEDNAFFNCGFTSFTIPDFVTSIGNGAFDGCRNLTTITIPSSVTKLEFALFSNCTELTSIISESKNPSPYPLTDRYTFVGIDYSKVTLYVPYGTIAKYRSAWGWIGKIEEFGTMSDPIIITAKDYTREYGEENPIFDYTASESIEGKPKITCSATKASPVGTYPIKIEQGSITDDNVSYVEGTLTITPAPLTIMAGNYTKQQGEDNPAFKPTYNGFKNGETEDVLTKKPTITCEATKDSEPGSYVIEISGAEAQNYDITYINGTLTVTDAIPVIITAKSYTREYGEKNPYFEYAVSGAVLEGEPVISCEADEKSPVGTYDIIISKGSVTNSNDTYINGTLTITEAPLTITAKSYTIKQGDDLPTFEALYDGFKNNETSNVLTAQPTFSCSATSTSVPGTYDIIVSDAMATNYDISYINGTLTVTPATYTLTYYVDGEVYKTVEYEYGETIIPEAEPTKEGYTFSGWSEIPATMPSNDVTVTGTFTVNSYKLTYMIDDDVYKEVMYEYGATITPEPQPDGNYVSFEWIGLPETMPANDVTVYASYETGIINVLMPQGVKAIYAPNGKKLDKLQKGVNIILMIDGKRKKVMVK